MTHRAVLCSVFLLFLCYVWQVQGAAIICGGSSLEPDSASKSNEPNNTTEPSKTSEVNQFLHNVQCTLEKAKPWIEDLEKEAKRLEETAKRVGLRIIHGFGDLMDSFLSAANRRPVHESTSSSSSVAASESSSSTTESLKEQLTTQSSSTDSPLNSLAEANDADNEIFKADTAVDSSKLQ